MLYRFRVTLSDSKFFFRIYDIDGSISLFALHNFLLNDMDFSTDQMTLFEGRPEQPAYFGAVPWVASKTATPVW